LQERGVSRAPPAQGVAIVWRGSTKLWTLARDTVKPRVHGAKSSVKKANWTGGTRGAVLSATASFAYLLLPNPACSPWPAPLPWRRDLPCHGR